MFIPQTALDNENITWPKKYIQREGAEKFISLKTILVKIINGDLKGYFSEAAAIVYNGKPRISGSDRHRTIMYNNILYR